MRAKRKHLIVKANPEQKESHEIQMPDGSTISIYLGRKFGENNREVYPNVCEIISVGDEVNGVSVGDKIILHHNIVTNEATHIKKEDGYVYMGIPADGLVYAKIQEDGTLIPLFRNLIGERIVKEKVSQFEYEDRTEQFKFKILSVPEDYTDVAVGDTILAYKYSDYEMVYHHNNRECRAIRIAADDVLGIFN